MSQMQRKKKGKNKRGNKKKTKGMTGGDLKRKECDK